MEIRAVAVIGLGTMGAGIAEVFARSGLPVTGIEADPSALDAGLAKITASLDKAVARGKLTQAERDAIAGRVTPGTSPADAAGADLVVEVVPEQLALKRQVIAELDRSIRPGSIIATNTSSLSVTTIAAASAHPGRVVGMHFFNPAPVMRLVEVVTTVRTDPAVAGAVTELARRLGKTPVQVADRAGFVANALLLPYLNHAARLLETGYATRADIDAAATDGIGLPMGPLALLDLIGLDTSLAVLDVLRHEFGGTRVTPAPILRRLTDAGRTGRKSGGGFYDYPARDASSSADSPFSGNTDQPATVGTVTLITPAASDRAPSLPLHTLPLHGGRAATHPHSDRALDLARLITAAGIGVTSDPSHPSDLAVVAIGPRGGVLGPAMAAGRAADAVGLHLATPGLAELVVTRLTSPGALAAARALVARLGISVVRAPDRPGLLVGALLYPHLRDAIVMVADGYASPADVDTAMTLGCGYPRGPMRMLADVGLVQAIDVLSDMHDDYGDPAFAPPPLLVECAMAGVGLDGGVWGDRPPGPAPDGQPT